MLTQIENAIDLFFKFVPRKAPQPIDLSDIKITAHRGAHSKELGIIENTWDAFEHAEKLGCFGIEFDIHATKDGVLVVHHDPDLKRLWGHPQHIAALNYQDLNKLVPQIPTLKDVIDRFSPNMHLFIEIKTPFQHIDTLHDTLSTVIPMQDYHLLSLCENLFNDFSKFPNECLLLVASHNNAKTFCETSIKNHWAGVLGHYLLLHDKLIQKLKSHNQKYGVGFVDSKNSLYRELNRGMKWLYTNNAHYICPLMKELSGMF